MYPKANNNNLHSTQPILSWCAPVEFIDNFKLKRFKFALIIVAVIIDTQLNKLCVFERNDCENI